MRFNWIIEPGDIERIRAVVEEHSTSTVVVDRFERNLASEKTTPTRDEFWHATVYALLTSVQRSGPSSRSTSFVKRQPFPLSLAACEECADLAALSAELLTGAGLRFAPKRIPGFLCANLRHMRGEAWSEIEAEIERLRLDQTVGAERRAARFISSPRLAGIGPKQSRNVLQYLGLTRWEIPIDSRLIEWFSDFGFPVPLSSAALSDHDYYEFVEDGIQLLCREAGVAPCVLDGAIFVSFDSEPWPANL